MMKIVSTAAFIAFFMMVMTLTTCSISPKEKEYMIFGYVGGFRDFDFSKIDATKLTHISYAFANIIDGKVMFGTDQIDNAEMNSSDIRKLNALIEAQP